MDERAPNWRYYALICLIGLVALIPLAINPGYFSHDEFQKADHVFRLGFWNYMVAYLSLEPGATFSTPVRPLSFAVQGVQALAMRDAPWLVHLSDIAMHLGASCLVMALAFRILADRSAALMAALLFAISPTAVFAVGWNAALMDRLYLLFTLVAALAAMRVVREPAWGFGYFVVFVASALAVVSKETAIVAPALVLVLVVLSVQALRSATFWGLLVCWAAPGAAVLLTRIPSLVTSFTADRVTHYRPSVLNVPLNALIYFGYPFLVSLPEAINWVFLEPWQIWLAAIAHAGLVIGIWYFYRWKVALIYLGAYFLFTVPIILLATPASHYLYGSGVALAVGVAALAAALWKRRLFIPLAVLLTGIGAMVVHSGANMASVYETGRCMKLTDATLQDVHRVLGYPGRLTVTVATGAPEHILLRLITGRDQIGTDRLVDVEIQPTSADAELLADCSVRLAHG